VGVDGRQVGGVDRACEAVTDPFHGRNVASHPTDIAGGRIDEHLVGLELKAAEVDLGGWDSPLRWPS